MQLHIHILQSKSGDLYVKAYHYFKMWLLFKLTFMFINAIYTIVCHLEYYPILND